MIGDQLYQADKNGALSLIDTGKETRWVLGNGNWYYLEDGVPVRNSFREINGAKYYFDYTGKMQTGLFSLWGDAEGSMIEKYYFADSSGEIIEKSNSWYYSNDNQKWYYFDQDGNPVNNKIEKIAGKEYYFDYEGEMKIGFFYYNNQKLFADASGAICRENKWYYNDGKWYYVTENEESAQSGIYTIGGKKYYFDFNGVMVTGKFNVWNGNTNDFYYANSSLEIVCNQWVKRGFDWFFAGEDGKLLTSQWMNDDFYFGETGLMAVGVVETDKGTYLFDDNGHKKEEVGTAKGWQLVDGTWYYYDEPGEPHNGWLDNKWYIEDGKMLTEAIVVSYDGEGDSYVGVDGLIQNGWIFNRYEWLYSEKGKIVKNCWKNIGHTRYYFSGYCMVIGLQEIDGKIHQFSDNGTWLGEVKTTGWFKSAAGAWYWINEDGTINK